MVPRDTLGKLRFGLVAPGGSALSIGRTRASLARWLAIFILGGAQADMRNCGIMPVTMAFTSDGQRAYAANHGSGEVSVINVANNKVVATIGVGKNPSGIAVSRDGRWIYVTNKDSNDVSVIDGADNRVVTTIPVEKGPVGIAIREGR